MMNTIHLPQWLIQLVIVVALPAVTCFGYYSLDQLAEDKSILALPVMLAYPAALIGLVGLFRAFHSPRHSRLALLLWALCVIVPVALLLWIRLD